MNRLTLEHLEDRRTPAWFYWVGDSNPATTGYLPWYTAAYWQGGNVPNNTTGADFVKITAGADKIALAGDFAGVTTTAGEPADILVKDSNTLKIRDLEVYAATTGRTTFTMESNTTIILAGPISARAGVVFDNSGGAAGNTNLLIDNAGQPMPTIGLLDRDGLIINGVNTMVTSGSTLMLWGNNGVGADAGYIKYINPTTNPATFTNNGSLYMTRKATVAFQSDFINYGSVAVQKSSTIVSHVLNGDTGVIDIPADGTAKIGWIGTNNQDLPAGREQVEVAVLGRQADGPKCPRDGRPPPPGGRVPPGEGLVGQHQGGHEFAEDGGGFREGHAAARRVTLVSVAGRGAAGQAEHD